ncbi:KIF-binding protein-like [Odontomachus brunneus]|uniref:KIF-binding protein-like n=1 Tax=Odontomachus brunneus TaxID=486640 RepID=UPI0013F24C54|nr:KIF-binding protein-like [Odontomachus brunneus]
MSTKTDESKCESATEVVESSCNLEDTIKPSDEFLQVFKLTLSFSKDQSNFSKKQIRTIEIKMDKLFHKVINSQDTKFEDIVTLAYSCQYLCFAYIKSDQTKNLSAAKDSILRCFHLLKDKQVDSKIILVTLKAYNLLSHIYHNQKKLENAIEILDNARDLYLIYMEEYNEHDIPIDYEDIIIKPSVQINGFLKLKSLYRNILQTSTDIHIKMRSKTSESFMLCRHLILVDELNYLQTPENCIQWIEMAMSVCSNLITCNRFAEAKNYIEQSYVVQAALYTKYVDSKKKGLSSKTSIIFTQYITMMKLIMLCYLRYAATLICQSVKRLLRLEKNIDSKTNISITKKLSKSEGRASRRLLLFYQNVEEYFNTNSYHAIPFTYILKYNEAQKQFVKILNVIYNSGLHLHFVEEVNFCIQTKLYVSNMYKYMAFYEKDTATQFLLRKRRAEILETSANIIRNTNDVKLLRFLWLQLTIAYSTLIDMKLEDIEAASLSYLSQRHDTFVGEINVLVSKSLIFLQKYMYYK